MTGPTPLFPVAASRADSEPNLRDLLRLLVKHGLLIVVCTALVTAAALVLYKMQQPVYTSTARVWVKTEQGSPSFLSGVTAYREPLYPDPVNRRIETEMELMLTRTSAASVVKGLNVRPEQLPTAPITPLVTSLVSLLPAPTTPPEEASNKLVDGFLKSLSVAPLRSKTADTTSNILEVRFESTDAALAPRALGRVLDNYLGVAASQNRRQGEEAARLLNSEVAQSREELLALDAQILALASRGPSVRSESSASSADSTEGSSRRSRREAREREKREGRESRESRRSSTFAGAPVGNEQALAALKTQTVEMQAELDALRELYTDDAENVRALKRRLGAMQRRLAEGLTASVQAVSSLGTLERQRQLAQERYNEVQKKLDQINLYLRLNPADAESRVIVDTPSQPVKSEGKKAPLIALVGPVAGLLLGLLLAGLRELFDQRLQSRRDVAASLGLPVLGALPSLGSAERQRLAGLPR
jgi:uncharacterized protein involved in exopolysaccharide biosynthesis